MKEALKLFNSSLTHFSSAVGRWANQIIEAEEHRKTIYYMWGMSKDDVKNFEIILRQCEAQGSVSIEEYYSMSYLTRHQLKRKLGLSFDQIKIMIALKTLTAERIKKAI